MHCRAQLCVSLSCKLGRLLCIQTMPGTLCYLKISKAPAGSLHNLTMPIRTARSHITNVLTRCARHRQVEQPLQLLPPSICAALALLAPAFSQNAQCWCQAKREVPWAECQEMCCQAGKLPRYGRAAKASLKCAAEGGSLWWLLPCGQALKLREATSTDTPLIQITSTLPWRID